ncbi:MAG: isoprenoid biosynthesis glyoxalase ElbB, partial [Phycisphaerales bacterium]|nr:isoprenoid biosynthesis glyoxalase ElbB [Phycisphaerales bacterium]
VYDGSEIHEAVLTLLHPDRCGAEVVMAAPDKPQMHVVDHLSGEPTGETRNVLVESARIARGKIADLASIDGAAFDAVVLPGGFGAAKNLSDFASRGEACAVDPGVERVLSEAHRAGRPIGVLCISPVIAARLLPGVEVTIGNDTQTARAIRAMGAGHAERQADDICIDERLRVVSTPAYMSARGIGEVDQGIGQVIEAVLQMAAAPVPPAAARG